MIKTVACDQSVYPFFQANGNAARFIIPFAQEVCKGYGIDVGCSKREWAFPGATPYDLVLNDVNADLIPESKESLDYIFSSHMLEHYVGNWTVLLEYWNSLLKPQGVLFLYLPDYSQKYWRPWNNKKHIHMLTPNIFEDYFSSTFVHLWSQCFVSGIDLNNSFAVILTKVDLNELPF